MFETSTRPRDLAKLAAAARGRDNSSRKEGDAMPADLRSRRHIAASARGPRCKRCSAETSRQRSGRRRSRDACAPLQCADALSDGRRDERAADSAASPRRKLVGKVSKVIAT
eukprot:994394-Pleurochrysis_carterae.AAC.1